MIPRTPRDRREEPVTRPRRPDARAVALPRTAALAPQAKHVDRGIVRTPQPRDLQCACDHTSDRAPSTQPLHARPPHGHHAGPDRPRRAEAGRRYEVKMQVTALRAETFAESHPQTYALRCAARRCPTHPDSKVTRNKKPQVRDLTWVDHGAPCRIRTDDLRITSPGGILPVGSGRFFGVRNHQVRTGTAPGSVHAMMVSATSSAHASLTHHVPPSTGFMRTTGATPTAKARGRGEAEC